jgi:hypothetical protein
MSPSAHHSSLPFVSFTHTHTIRPSLQHQDIISELRTFDSHQLEYYPSSTRSPERPRSHLHPHSTLPPPASQHACVRVLLQVRKHDCHQHHLHRLRPQAVQQLPSVLNRHALLAYWLCCFAMFYTWTPRVGCAATPGSFLHSKQPTMRAAKASGYKGQLPAKKKITKIPTEILKQQKKKGD